MAEEDAEIALLHQLQAGQDSVTWENSGENGVAGGEQPSNTEHNNQEVQKEVAADDQVLRALSPSGDDAVSDGGEYDPSSVTTQPAVTIAGEEASRSSSAASTRKRKTVGGFLADDSDDETDSSTPAQKSTSLLQPPVSSAAAKRSPSPLQTSVTQQDVQESPMNQSDSKDFPISSTVPFVNPPSAGQSTVQASAIQSLTSAGPSQTVLPKARLPNDKIGILEDKIKEDPRGDLESWMSLINEHITRDKIEDARAVYERFFKVFPHAGEVWAAWAETELSLEQRSGAEAVFRGSLLSVASLQLWSVYLDYIRRITDIVNDPTGNNRKVVAEAYNFVLDNVGIDRDSGRIWQEYIQFVRSGPFNIGGDGWQDKQKTDQVRNAYQKAIVVPMSMLNPLWKEYDQFEMGLNKVTGRKFLQERSAGYMTARTANTALENLTRGLNRTTLPKLPPAMGFEGDVEYVQQVEIWKKWIAWEQEDPLFLKADENAVYQKRVLYVFKQALMALRFWPEMWVEAADWCYANGLDAEADKFLDDGMVANPESCLLAFKKADRLESHPTGGDGEGGKNPVEQGALVRAPFDKLLDALYELIKQLKVREARDLAKLEESLALDASISAIISKDADEEENQAAKKARDADKDNKTKAIQAGYASQAELISRTISFAWVALMRAMRRVQGKGSVKDVIGGSRQIFADARARGKLTSDVYVASALIEHHVYKDPAGAKIFERGAKLFPEDGAFILEYLKHLLSTGDTTNARVAFETAVNRLMKKPELVHRAKPLYLYFHKYESQYGELSQIRKLEQRMTELFPDDPKLLQFSNRYNTEGFDPTAIRPIISPATQMRPKGMSVLPSIEQHTRQTSVQNNSPRPHFVQENSPRPQFPMNTNSPKRPFSIDDEELNRPRKLARGESPLKGAAGRRLNQQKALQQNQGTPAWQSNAPPVVIPRDITFLLSIIPRRDFYHEEKKKFNGSAMVRLLSQINVPDYATWKATSQTQQAGPAYGRASAVQNDRPQSRDPAQYNYADDRHTTGGHSWQNQANNYAGVPSPVPHAGGAFSRPPPAQALHLQGLPPRPESNNPGYYQQDYTSAPPPAASGNWQPQPQPQYQGPSLLPTQTWSQTPTNSYPPGPPGYSYNR